MSSELAHGQLLADYEIVCVAGSGGMGVVYQAKQRSLGRRVALKVIREEIVRMPAYRERFLREARLAAAVDHPNVVPVYDVGDEGGQLYLAMQWIDGEDLKRLIERSGALEPDRAVAIVVQLAAALDVLHRDAGLVHRDIKPANVLVRQVGGKDHAYLTDFGVAKPAENTDQLTQTGWIVGTAGYLSPEQIMGEEPGPRSDLYALGCVLFEALTGRPPFEAHNEMGLRWAHANDPRPTASTVNPSLGGRYNQFFAVALAVDPMQRFGSSKEFSEALASVRDREDAIETRENPRTLRVPTAIGPATPIGPRLQPVAPGGYSAFGHGTPPPGDLRHSRSGNPLALIILGIVAVVGIAIGGLAAAGAFSHAVESTAAAAARTASTSTRTVTTSTVLTTTSTSVSTTRSATSSTANESSTAATGSGVPVMATNTYAGRAFSISYPVGWTIEDAERPVTYGTDTTIVSPQEPGMLLRVDMNPNPASTDPMADVQPVLKELEPQPGYSLIDLSRETFDGFPAVHWEFTVEESGVLLQKEDEFFQDTTTGAAFAILTSAPADQYAAMASEFASLRNSVAIN
jgi:serine/threonine protein kinase